MSSPRGSRSRARLALSAAGCLLALAPAVRADSGSIEEVADCAIRNLPPSAHAHALLKARSADGAERDVDVEYWSRTGEEGTRKIVIARRAAPDNAVAAYLFSDGDAVGEAWLFSKSDGKARRLDGGVGTARLFGSNVSLEDFARFARVVFPGQVRRLPDTDVGGRKAYVVETKPSPDAGSAYSRIVTSIDREWCLILRRESFDPAFENGAKPRKVYEVSASDVKQKDGFANAWRARQDDAQDGSSTEMKIVDLELPAKIDESFFTPAALERAAH
jgi:Outer membrane lipoprotein-sorting protein